MSSLLNSSECAKATALLVSSPSGRTSLLKFEYVVPGAGISFFCTTTTAVQCRECRENDVGLQNYVL